ncbi:MAG: TIGR01548 family HAD-type hydrolase [Synechococcus sp.]
MTAAPSALLLFDIDGVIRDVGGSYRRAITATVQHFGGPRPDLEAIDSLKAEGCWNNDWEASHELLRRSGIDPLPTFAAVVEVFNGFYFGGDPDGDPRQWRGFIGGEPLLVQPDFFAGLSAAGLAWGFVSGAEPPSARFVIEARLGLAAPPLIAMGDAPDKPDPTGLLRLAAQLEGNHGPLPLAYVGDTVADVLTVVHARRAEPERPLRAIGVLPPHRGAEGAAGAYGNRLRDAGADLVLTSVNDLDPTALAAALSGCAPWPPAA